MNRIFTSALIVIVLALIGASSAHALQSPHPLASTAPSLEPCFVEGRITRASDGQPVAGATVRLQTLDRWRQCGTGWATENACDFVDATTDAKGEYQMRLPESFNFASLYVLPTPGNGQASLPAPQGWHPSVSEPGTTFTADATVGPGYSFRGCITDEQGDPIAGAEVRVWQYLVALEFPLEPTPPFVRTKAADVIVSTDAAGSFALAAVGSWATLRIDAPGFVSEELKLALKDPDDQTLRPIQMEAEQFIECSVVDEHGAPAREVRVNFSRGSRRDSWKDRLGNGVRRAEARSASGVTDKRGRCRIGPLPRGPFEVSLTGTPFLPLETTVELPVESATWTLSRGTELAGRVVDHDGNPIEGAQLWTQAYGPSEEGSYGYARALTPPEGSFRFTGVPTDKPASLKVSADGYASRVLTGPAPRADPATAFEIVLQPERILTGLLLDPNGEPLPYHDISLFSNVLSEGQTPLSFEHGGLEASVGTLAKSRTDADGRFIVDKLPPGPYLLRARQEKQLFAVEDTSSALTVQLRAPQDSRRRVLGQVRNALTGDPIEDYELKLTGGRAETLRRDGSNFRFELEREHGLLTVRAPGLTLWRESFRLWDFWDYPRDVVLEPASAITLRTVTAAGAMAPNVLLSITRPDGRPVTAVLQDGEVRGPRFSSGAIGLTHLDLLPRDQLRLSLESLNPQDPRATVQHWDVDLRTAEGPKFIELVID